MKRVLFFALLLMSCNIDVIDFSRVSDNIDQSTKNGVFLYSLKVDKPVINIMDNQQSSIKQAFVEYQWKYVSHYVFFTKIKKDSVQQLVIHFAHLPVYEGANSDVWLKQGNHYFGWMGGAAAEPLNNINFDSLIYVVYKPFASKEVSILDSFKLVK